MSSIPLRLMRLMEVNEYDFFGPGFSTTAPNWISKICKGKTDS